jgi:hypothetical protein
MGILDLLSRQTEEKWRELQELQDKMRDKCPFAIGDIITNGDKVVRVNSIQFTHMRPYRLILFCSPSTREGVVSRGTIRITMNRFGEWYHA